ncbi:zinc-regulated transporter 2 [Pestalotiopsis sp. NC0098]|nr:zinc-regulated transporter 2 [Pestalotiopsis sp. NC0098]
MPDGTPKPVCGGGQEAGEYDLPLHTVGLFLVMGASIFGAGFPVAAKKVRWLKVPEKVFFACKHFGTGVLIATAFVHLLPTAFGSLGDPCLPDLFTDDYPPMPGAIMMASLFSLFVIELYLNGKMGGHSHGGAKGFEASMTPEQMAKMAGVNINSPPGPRRPSQDSYDTIAFEKKVAQAMENEVYGAPPQTAFGAELGQVNTNNSGNPNSEMPPWFVVFYEQYVRQRLEMLSLIKASGVPAPKQQQEVSVVATEPMFDVEGQTVDPAVYKRMSMNITLLEGGILFHSVFVGMTVSITIEGFVVLLIAILFHQMFEGLGLGSRIAAVPYPKGSWKPWLLVFAFGTTAPIGQAIGLIARNSYDPNSAFGLIIVGVCNAISSGLLIYAATVDLLAEDFLSEEAQHSLTKKDKIQAFCWVLTGAAGMSIVGAFA